jgi:hypothetical protein
MADHGDDWAAREIALYAEHAAALSGRVANFGSHAEGCPQECPYRGQHEIATVLDSTAGTSLTSAPA